MDEEEEPSGDDFPSNPITWLDPIIRFLVMLETVVGGVATFFGGLATDFMQHYNHRADKKLFENVIREGIESIPTTKE